MREIWVTLFGIIGALLLVFLFLALGILLLMPLLGSPAWMGFFYWCCCIVVIVSWVLLVLFWLFLCFQDIREARRKLREEKTADGAITQDE